MMNNLRRYTPSPNSGNLVPNQINPYKHFPRLIRLPKYSPFSIKLSEIHVANEIYDNGPTKRAKFVKQVTGQVLKIGTIAILPASLSHLISSESNSTILLLSIVIPYSVSVLSHIINRSLTSPFVQKTIAKLTDDKEDPTTTEKILNLINNNKKLIKNSILLNILEEGTNLIKRNKNNSSVITLLSNLSKFDNAKSEESLAIKDFIDKCMSILIQDYKPIIKNKRVRPRGKIVESNLKIFLLTKVIDPLTQGLNFIIKTINNKFMHALTGKDGFNMFKNSTELEKDLATIFLAKKELISFPGLSQKLSLLSMVGMMASWYPQELLFSRIFSSLDLNLNSSFIASVITILPWILSDTNQNIVKGTQQRNPSLHFSAHVIKVLTPLLKSKIFNITHNFTTFVTEISEYMMNTFRKNN